MKILILGGTRFIGRHLIDAAHARGHEVTVFNRGRHGLEDHPEVERLRGDRYGDLSALGRGSWDPCVDTCGYLPSVVDASAGLLADRVGRYTFISSGSVYADLSAPSLDESSPVGSLTDEELREVEAIRPTDGPSAVAYGEWYGPLKVLCERAAEARMPGRITNVRAGLIVGPHDYTDRFTYWIRRVAAGGDVLAPGRPGRKIQFVDARDLAEWIVRMGESNGTGTYNVTGPAGLLTMGALLEACREATGGDARLVWAGERFLLDEGVVPWSEMPLWIPESAEELRAFFETRCDRAIRAGLTFRPLVETVRDTHAWDATRPQAEPLRAGLIATREAALLRAWRASTGAPPATR